MKTASNEHRDARKVEDVIANREQLSHYLNCQHTNYLLFGEKKDPSPKKQAKKDGKMPRRRHDVERLDRLHTQDDTLIFFDKGW